MVGIDFDSMTLEQMREKLLEAKEILKYLNDEYDLDSIVREKLDDFQDSIYYNLEICSVKVDVMPYYLGSECLWRACKCIDDYFIER